MEFGIDKCVTISIKRGKIVEFKGILDREVVRSLKDGKNNMYLSILQANQVKHNEIKRKVKGEYFRCVSKILETKLNSRNIIQAINTWAISLLHYSATFLDWNYAELDDMATRTRKMNIHKALNPNGDVIVVC